MSTFGKIVGINLLIMLAYGVISLIVDGSNEGLLAAAIIAMLHSILCLIIGLVYLFSKNTESGGAWVASFAIILVIGISSCFGGFAL